ncbi:acetyltransferase-like protein [Diatraea saccharalis granulovirus]|uniref:Acetyltransferase-like protein n=1 Tax=Diatraea saccharalis granulovirus TaxID=1675862 RepID=A0A0R7EYY2_9BBAC|nr:acetyltransferase-like protein [Diatraea saccharalis granulovirus]AKN80795.1 acetyltransferase-like protein [Diatraea saccharalis granulovirus]
MDTLVPFGRVQFKRTHHHYCGFYSLQQLSSIVDDKVVVNGKEYEVTGETAIDWAYDGVDTIVAEKRLVYSKEEWPLHGVIYNINEEIVGLVGQGVKTADGDYCYAIQDGFNLYTNHLSNINLIVREKNKLIAYADKEFDDKNELIKYLDNTKGGGGEVGAILYHKNKKQAQLILYQSGVQLSNTHLRKSVFGVL